MPKPSSLYRPLSRKCAKLANLFRLRPLLVALATLAAIYCGYLGFSYWSANQPRVIPFSEFVAEIETHASQKQPISLSISPSDMNAVLEFRAGNRVGRLETVIPSSGGALDKLTSLALGLRVEVIFRTTSSRFLIELPIYFFMISLLITVLEISGTRARLIASFKRQNRSNVRNSTSLADIHGLDLILDEVNSAVTSLRDSILPKQKRRRLPTGILLHGLPGCGKTMLARAIANEAGVRFFEYNAADFGSSLMGISPGLIRNAFAKARRHAPAVLFIDEFDGIGGRRIADPSSAACREENRVVTALLTELDGFTQHADKPILLIAATNMPNLVDPALRRSGRLDTSLHITLPNEQARKSIVQSRLVGVASFTETERGTIASQFAKMSLGLSPADLTRVFEEAIDNAPAGAEVKEFAEIAMNSLERVVNGPRSSVEMSPEAREIAAFHEAGHAVAAHFIANAQVMRISIAPRDNSLGSTFMAMGGDVALRTSGQILNDLDTILAGRIAEFIQYGQVSTGSANDLVKADGIARAYIRDWRMDVGSSSDWTVRLRGRIDELIHRSEARVEAVLRDNWDNVELVAAMLIKTSTVTAGEFMDLVAPTLPA